MKHWRRYISGDVLIAGAVMVLFIIAVLFSCGCANRIYVAGNADIRMGATVTEVRDNQTSGTLKVEKGNWIADAVTAAVGLWK